MTHCSLSLHHPPILFLDYQDKFALSANVPVVPRSRWPAESCLISVRGDKKLLPARSVPTMSPHIFTLIPLILTSMVVTLPSTVSMASRSLTCLPSSSSLEVPSEGELKVQCNVTVPEEQVRISFFFSCILVFLLSCFLVFTLVEKIQTRCFGT